MKTVEPVFGQVKQGRGFRQFLLRGLEKANREWLMICTGHNLLKLSGLGAQPRHEPRSPACPSALGVQISVESGVSFDEHR